MPADSAGDPRGNCLSVTGNQRVKRHPIAHLRAQRERFPKVGCRDQSKGNQQRYTRERGKVGIDILVGEQGFLTPHGKERKSQ
ncbi:hypothetical protein BHM03_00000847 [Ensete ventricosum]|nr:hypothetical protein BHM03_00000847 [Ensete ventricosum]